MSTENKMTKIPQAQAEKKEEWLHALPKVIKTYEEKWQVKIHEPFANLSFNWVAPALCADGTKAVFKFGLETRELASEINALKAWQGKGAVHLLNSDAEAGVLLLEQLEPGESFWHTKDDVLASNVCADLLLELWQADVPENTRTLENWTHELVDYHEKSDAKQLPQDLVDLALQLRKDLLQQPETVLLHADLHHDNILSATRQAYLAIDPKGIAGPKGYDVASFLMNPFGITKPKNHKQKLETRLNIFSEKLELSLEELASWGIMHCVLSVVWSLGYDGSYDGEPEPLEIARVLKQIAL